MKYAIINGTDVVNSIEYDTQPSNPPPGFESPIIAVQNNEAGPGWKYVQGQFVAPVVPDPTEEELLHKCKAIATGMLSLTDWTVASDVGDPALSSPYLINKSEFITYRNIVRGFAIHPVTDPVFPVQPTEQWSS
jgi:hypothetical protein